MRKNAKYTLNIKRDEDGGAVAEWSKALLLREKIHKNQKIPGSPPAAWANSKKERLR